MAVLTRHNAPKAVRRLADLYTPLTMEDVVGDGVDHNDPLATIIHNEEIEMNATVETTSNNTTPNYDFTGAIKRDIDAPIEAPTYEVGETVFDVLDADTCEFGGVEQREAWKVIANSALARAIYAAFGYVRALASENASEEQIIAAQQRAGRWSDLAAYAVAENATLSESKWDRAMELDAMFELLCSDSDRVSDNDAALFEAVSATMNLGESELAIVRQQRQLWLREEAKRQREKLRACKDDVIAMVEQGDPNQFDPALFTADEHAALYTKLFDKLRAAALRQLKLVGRFDTAASDATVLNAAAAVFDRKGMAFRRRNRHELRTDALAA